jgi:hypothetical protein
MLNESEIFRLNFIHFEGETRLLLGLVKQGPRKPKLPKEIGDANLVPNAMAGVKLNQEPTRNRIMK